MNSGVTALAVAIYFRDQGKRIQFPKAFPSKALTPCQ